MTDTITLPRSVLEQALEALNASMPHNNDMDQDWLSHIAARRTLRAALEQPDIGITTSVPSGWKLVPVDPADSQIRAAQDTWWHACNCETYWDQIYVAMIDAAPKPPVVAQPKSTRLEIAIPDKLASQVIDALASYCNTGEIEGADDLLASLLYSIEHPHPKREPLTDELIDKIADGMPGGLDGFMKGWGWRQFARAVEARGIGG